MPHVISEADWPAVARGLKAAFGTTELDAAAPLSGGLSGARIYRIRVGGIAYLLRVETGRDAFRDPARSYACMKIAAAGMLAPRVRYAAAEDGVAIMDFIVEQSLTLTYAGTRADLIVEAAQAIRALHAGPPFPPLVDYLDGMDALIAGFQAQGLVAPEATAELFDLYGRLRAAYRTDPADLVASHNDLNPRNVLYDGQRLWFVDWESAFLADRYVDLACLANLYASGPEEEALLLRTYFGQASDTMRAKLFLMRQVNHVFYAAVMMSGVRAARTTTLAGPTLAELHAALSIGRFDLAGDAGRITYGKARLTEALANLRSPRFEQALALAY